MQRDAVVGLVPVRHDVVAERLDRLARKRLIDAFDLLQADEIGLALLQPCQQMIEALAHRVDVPCRDAHGRCQIEKLVPQPHEAVAFGLLTRNDAPIRSSTKSSSEPARNGTEAESTNTTAPSRAITMSSSVWVLSMLNLYWKPEQPPPSTLTRSLAPSPSLLRISPIRRAARSEMVTFSVTSALLRIRECLNLPLSIVKYSPRQNQTPKERPECPWDGRRLPLPTAATPICAAAAASMSRRAATAAPS